MMISWKKLCREQLLTEITVKITENIDDRVYVVGIDGCACSGKTQLASELCREISQKGYGVAILSIDDFCNPKNQRYISSEPDDLQVYKYNFDLNRYVEIIDLIVKHANTVRYQVFDVISDKLVSTIDLSGKKIQVLICEGIHLLRPELFRLFDFSIYLEITGKEQMLRAYERDPKRGKTQEEIAYKYAKRYRPSYIHHTKKNKPRNIADVVIENSKISFPNYVFKDEI